jgi:hypothetical protein
MTEELLMEMAMPAGRTTEVVATARGLRGLADPDAAAVSVIVIETGSVTETGIESEIARGIASEIVSGSAVLRENVTKIREVIETGDRLRQEHKPPRVAGMIANLLDDPDESLRAFQDRQGTFLHQGLSKVVVAVLAEETRPAVLESRDIAASPLRPAEMRNGTAEVEVVDIGMLVEEIRAPERETIVASRGRNGDGRDEARREPRRSPTSGKSDKGDRSCRVHRRGEEHFDRTTVSTSFE